MSVIFFDDMDKVSFNATRLKYASFDKDADKLDFSSLGYFSYVYGHRVSMLGPRWQLSDIERKYYLFLSEKEALILYLFYRGIKQTPLAKILKTNQTTVSYRLRRIQKKLKFLGEVVFPLLVIYDTYFDRLLEILSTVEMVLLREIIVKMSQSFAKVFNFEQSRVRVMYYMLVKKIKNAGLEDFADMLKNNVVWGLMGRDFYQHKEDKDV